MKILDIATSVVGIAAIFDPALAPVAAVLGGADKIVDTIEDPPPLLVEVSNLLKAHSGDHAAAALKLRSFNSLPQDEQNAIMDRQGAGL